ncbi:MAG: glutathione S-transferase family protein [Rhizobiaceae bacterium]|nr:glutathione S-transferase family protein [Rhizobiaceae bacterium]
MLKFYHAPWSRSSGILWLLEELGADFEIVPIDIRAEGGVPETYRSIQPNKKVPAVEHNGVVITERPAISIYLADAFPQAGLAPTIGSRDRGPYLSMLVYCAAVIDPCITMKSKGLSYESNDHAFGLFDDMVAFVERTLTGHPFAAGDRFTAADVQLASTIEFTMNTINVLPRRQAFVDYLARIGERPALQRANEKDLALAKTVPFFQKQFAAGAQGA